jgi:hypothetical protein
MRQDHVDGVTIAEEPDTYTYRVLLGRLALQYRLPAICYFTDSVEAGALMSYGFDLKAEARRIAAQIVEVLNGGNTAEMPSIQETHFPLVINLKAAKELGLEIPARLVEIKLGRAFVYEARCVRSASAGQCQYPRCRLSIITTARDSWEIECPEDHAQILQTLDHNEHGPSPKISQV